MSLQKYAKDRTGQAESQLCGGNYIGTVLTVACREKFGMFKPPEILKALQNRAKVNPIVKTA